MNTLGGHRKPVERVKVLLGAVGLLALLGAVVGIGQVLRHPDRPTGVPEEQLEGADPRDDINCPDPLPREGEPRDVNRGSSSVVDVSSNNLYDCPQSYDGQRVRFRGEVVGALLHRETGVWIQLNDDVYAELIGPLPAHRDYRGGNAGVGVMLPTQLAEQIDFVGGPQTRGDVIEVEGTFHRVDPSDEVAVIRADTARLTTSGEPFPDPVQTDRLVAAFLAVLLSGGMVVAERVVARQR